MSNRRDFWGRIVAESALIVMSILVALWVDASREQADRDALRDQALDHIRAELQHNLDEIERALPYHDSVLVRANEVFANEGALAGQPLMAVVGRMAPRGVLPPDLRRTAWDAAVAAQAVALFDFETASAISGVYGWQEIGVRATMLRMSDRIFTLESFDPAQTIHMSRLLQALMNEMTSQERSLAGQYRAVLEQLEAGPQE